MADLFLDIRDRHIRAITAENGEKRFQRIYPLDSSESERGHSGQPSNQTRLREGELSGIIARIRTESPVGIEQAHLVLPNQDVTFATHRLPKMPQQEALKLVVRKTAEETHEEFPQIGLIPQSSEQNSQLWISEYVSTASLIDYKKEFDSARIKLKTVSTVLDSTLKAIAPVRESIFNAHAIFEINATSIEVYYVSASALLLHETLEINVEDDRKESQDPERIQKRRMFTVLDMLYHVNSQYLAANPMTPLQKVWLCGTDSTIPALGPALQDAMDVETSLLYDETDDPMTGCPFVVLQGLVKACADSSVVNFMHPDLLRRFPLRKKSGMLIYIATTLLAVAFVLTTEYRHTNLKKQVKLLDKASAEQKKSKAASDELAKSIDTLKKLTGSQIVLYPIFRDLAENLPEGVYLSSLDFTYKDSKSFLDLAASFRHSGDLGANKTLTKIMDSLSKSPGLLVNREPSITSTTKDDQTIVTVKLSCEVRPRDAAK
jgi:Tfp pilus assembly protein PilN